MSNFAPYGFELDGKVWKTVEHYYQAQKFKDEKLQEKIRQVSSPMAAAILGRNKNSPLRSDWESYKLRAMYKALQAKFEQHEDIREQLIETNDAKLVEYSKKDKFWGNGGDGSGKNALGRMLMKLRNELKIGDEI